MSRLISQNYAAVVVGAGPAGVAALGNLLELGLTRIAWVDPVFDGGRVNSKYREVPSNTKVSFFRSYATGVQPLRNIVSTTKTPNAFSVMNKLDQDETCSLHHAADMVKDLTAGLLKMRQVSPFRGEVTSANFEDQKSRWTIRIKSTDPFSNIEVSAPRLILCTGSSPKSLPAPTPGAAGSTPTLKELNLDTVLKPSILSDVLPRDIPTTIAVIGGSHSAILAIMNLVDLAQTSHPSIRLKWFTRNPLKYAVFMEGGWILYDNTGLKGQAAQFAREQLEDSRLETSVAGRFIEKIDTSDKTREDALYQTHLPECSHVVYAIGYERNALPELSRNGRPLVSRQQDLKWESEFGGFLDDRGEVIPGLHGAGIAFPETVVDPKGNVEQAVGFFKFMKFLKRVTPLWV
ncbi:conserved hypothetical protein [Talaromyces stipitatus ATCC 10500]|uniref:FAD/NAD(P)-binding domain-containing protein n=1 Tax=Talaromyces stipitatus (strain ATCC 10500 / CBS 375.48 / QM 6759 / NRRL 1006) TaxID=441959 RepID=B8MDW8_TALSN|nr:uncharacterized protein TSTA_011540 [Talaromyces stipitatus ATCC 10500]EED16045.1 conserved hypothetical protein [Talaromyces stipitatus ATCC 10500]